MNRLPFMYIAQEFARVVGGYTVRVLLYGAYNAYGLIGPEHNGIAIANETNRGVVLDEHLCKNPGWYPGFGGPSAKQQQEMSRLAQLTEAEFLSFVRLHQRYRDASL